MRVRKKKNLAARTERVSSLMIGEPRRMKGHWSEISGGRPVWLEIGCGKGRFAVGTASRERDAFVVAIEMEPNVLVVAMENAAKAECDNLRFLSLDAAMLDSCFAPGEVSRIYLNFSDPWPHNKNRRLTYERFLASYARVLAADGELRFKTDNRSLFDWSETELIRCGWNIRDISRDIHGAEPADGGIVTEYEERFMSLGTPINFLRALPPAERHEEKLEFVGCEDPAELAKFSLRIWRARFTPIYGRLRTAELIAARRDERAFAGLLGDGFSCEFLKIDGENAGLLVAKNDGDLLTIEELSVDMRSRGRGFGRLLVETAERRAAGAPEIAAYCPAEDIRGLEAAAALGFEQTGSASERGVRLRLKRIRPRWKYLLLDADNTLFDFTGAERRAIARTLEGSGISGCEENCRLYSRINDEEWKKLERGEVTSEQLRANRFARLGEALGVPIDPAAINVLYMQMLIEESQLLPGALETVARLSRECAVAIVTNGIPVVQRGRLGRSGLQPYIHGMFISGEVGYSKPAREYFDEVCRMFGISDRSEALVVGDSLTSDIAGARNAGIAGCLYDPHHAHPDPPADYTVSSYAELIALVEGE